MVRVPDKRVPDPVVRLGCERGKEVVDKDEVVVVARDCYVALWTLR